MDPIEWYREDYRSRRTEIEQRLELEQNLVNYSLLGLAGLTALIGGIYGRVDLICPIALAASLFFLSLTVVYLRHDLFIAYNAQYIEECIHRNIPDLPLGALTWEN